MELNLAGRTALVTGAHRGTGRAIAAALAQEGVKVWLHGFDTTATEAACDGIPGARPLVNALDSDAAVAELVTFLGDSPLVNPSTRRTREARVPGCTRHLGRSD